MTIIEPTPAEVRTGSRSSPDGWRLAWSPIILGALAASAVASILITFGTAIGLGVSSASPTWRDTSFALWLLSGIYLVLTALVSFGCGGYLAGRTRSPSAPAAADDVEQSDGWHGLGSWALAILLGAIISALIGMAANRPTSLTTPQGTSEPSVLSYEIDHLLRAPRRLPNAEIAPLRAESSRILLTSSSHSGVSADDRTYLVQMVSAVTGLTGAEAERRVDNAIADSRKAIAKTRASTVILAFSLATSLLLGAVAAWSAAEAGGRHRDGMPLPGWMTHTSQFNRRRAPWERPAHMP